MTTYLIPPGDTLWAIPVGGRWYVTNHSGDVAAEATLTGAGVSLAEAAGPWWVANSAYPNWQHTHRAVAKDDLRPCRICGRWCAYQQAPFPQFGSGWRHVDPADEVPGHVGYPDGA